MLFPGVCVFGLFRFFANVFVLQTDFITANRKKICIHFKTAPYGKDVLRSVLTMSDVIQTTGINFLSKRCEQHMSYSESPWLCS